MKNTRSELNKLAQKKIIDFPQYLFENSSNDHQKNFLCTIKLQGFNNFSATAPRKNNARPKAADLFPKNLKITVDLTKKPQKKNLQKIRGKRSIAFLYHKNTIQH